MDARGSLIGGNVSQAFMFSYFCGNYKEMIEDFNLKWSIFGSSILIPFKGF